MQTLAGGQWHAISEESISLTPQSTITTRVSDFDTWDSDWLERHLDHADPDDPECIFVDPDDGDPDNEHGDLLQCCGEKRPEPPGPLVIHATSKEYVTVHDFVSTVHPWLMEHFSDIWSALHIWDGDEYDSSQKLIVSFSDLESLSILSEDMWTQFHQTITPGPGPGPALASRPVADPSAAPHAGVEPQVLHRNGPLIHKASPEFIRMLNEQMRREGNPTRYNEW